MFVGFLQRQVHILTLTWWHVPWRRTGVVQRCNPLISVQIPLSNWIHGVCWSNCCSWQLLLSIPAWRLRQAVILLRKSPEKFAGRHQLIKHMQSEFEIMNHSLTSWGEKGALRKSSNSALRAAGLLGRALVGRELNIKKSQSHRLSNY